MMTEIIDPVLREEIEYMLREAKRKDAFDAQPAEWSKEGIALRMKEHAEAMAADVDPDDQRNYAMRWRRR